MVGWLGSAGLTAWTGADTGGSNVEVPAPYEARMDTRWRPGGGEQAATWRLQADGYRCRAAAQRTARTTPEHTRHGSSDAGQERPWDVGPIRTP